MLPPDIGQWPQFFSMLGFLVKLITLLKPRPESKRKEKIGWRQSYTAVTSSQQFMTTYKNFQIFADLEHSGTRNLAEYDVACCISNLVAFHREVFGALSNM